MKVQVTPRKYCSEKAADDIRGWLFFQNGGWLGPQRRFFGWGQWDDAVGSFNAPEIVWEHQLSDLNLLQEADQVADAEVKQLWETTLPDEGIRLAATKRIARGLLGFARIDKVWLLCGGIRNSGETPFLLL